MGDQAFRDEQYICFCKQVIHKVTRTENFRFTVEEKNKNKYDEEITVEHKICGAMFRRGEFFISGTFPYGKLACPPLPDLTKTGNDRGGMLHLAGLCPRHAVHFEDKMYRFLSHDGDSDSPIHSGDDPADPAVSKPPSETSSAT